MLKFRFLHYNFKHIFNFTQTNYFNMGSLFAKFILRIVNWKIVGWNLNELDKYVIIEIPHTSNWDFPLGILLRAAQKAPHVYFVGKKSLFKWPFGYIFKALGGYPVDRKKSQNFVDSITELYQKEDRFAICLAPEGTRSKAEKLKTGFYYLAINAKVPIVMVSFDYSRKQIVVAEPFEPSGDYEKDIPIMKKFFSDKVGKRPEDGFTFQ